SRARSQTGARRGGAAAPGRAGRRAARHRGVRRGRRAAAGRGRGARGVRAHRAARGAAARRDDDAARQLGGLRRDRGARGRRVRGHGHGRRHRPVGPRAAVARRRGGARGGRDDRRRAPAPRSAGAVHRAHRRRREGQQAALLDRRDAGGRADRAVREGEPGPRGRPGDRRRRGPRGGAPRRDLALARRSRAVRVPDMRARWLAVELAALALAIAAAWWLAGAASSAWLSRVARLGVPGPGADEVHALARRAAIYMTAGIAALAAGRAVGRRRRGDPDAHEAGPIAVPWLVPAAVIAALFGLALHLATVEVVRGAAVAPTGAGFAQGFLLGCLAAAALMLAPVDLAQAASRARTGLAVAIGAIFAALAIAGSGPPGSGTRINLGPVQPIELVKPLAVAFLAAYLGARAPKLRWQRRRLLGLRWPRLELLVPALGVLLAIVAGLYVIGDLGPVLLLALVFLGMFFVTSRATGWVVVAFALIAAAIAVLALWPALAGGGTVQTRLVMWREPWTNGLTNGHQLGEGLWAINAGGWSGQGLARAATPLVPAGKTDLALATLTEQLGARGLVAYQLALGALVLGALHAAARSRTAERVLIASGIGILVLAQWLVILGGTLGYLPLTGIVVPFVSAGRSSMAVFVV